MKVAITGATGYIGKHVVAFLLQKGHEVVICSRSKAEAANKNPQALLTHIPIDLKNRTEDNLFEYLLNPDVVIHLAWEGLPNYNENYHLTNLSDHIWFIENLLKNGLSNITITGTCLEYGLQSGELLEHMPTDPITAYGVAKDCLRKILETYLRGSNVSFKWARLFYSYGEGQNEKAILTALKKAIERGDKEFEMSNGEQLRDYLPVQKVSEYLVTIALQEKVNGVINCCSGLPISVRALVESYLTANKSEIKLNLGFYPYPDYEPLAFWGNNKKLQQILENEFLR
jgi:nucleoside-diphosphate-sugar epimerase